MLLVGYKKNFNAKKPNELPNNILKLRNPKKSNGKKEKCIVNLSTSEHQYYAIQLLLKHELLSIIYTVDTYEVCSTVPQWDGQSQHTRPVEDPFTTEIFVQFSFKKKRETKVVHNSSIACSISFQGIRKTVGTPNAWKNFSCGDTTKKG